MAKGKFGPGNGRPKGSKRWDDHAMNGLELQRIVALRLGLRSTVEGRMIVPLVFACIAEALAQGRPVRIRQFGLFRLHVREARLGWISTQQRVGVWKRKVKVKFDYAPQLEGLLNGTVAEPCDHNPTVRELMKIKVEPIASTTFRNKRERIAAGVSGAAAKPKRLSRGQSFPAVTPVEFVGDEEPDSLSTAKPTAE